MQHKDTYILIMQRLSIQELGCVAQTSQQNRTQSSLDDIWKPVFLRDFGSNKVYQGSDRHTVCADFKVAYKKFKNLLPLLHSKDVYELAAQMIALAPLFTQPRLTQKRQVKLVWYRSSSDGSLITRQNGVRDTYRKICNRKQPNDSVCDKRPSKKACIDTLQTFEVDENNPFEYFR